MPSNDPSDEDEDEEALKPMTGAQLSLRATARPRARPNSNTAERPSTGTQPAFRPVSGSTTGKFAAVGRSGTRTNTFAPLKPSVETKPLEPKEVPPVFKPERLKAHIRAMSLTESALGRVTKQQAKVPAAGDDTFVKTKMKQAEAKVPDFDLDKDLG